jgi:nucleotide-binding universal stress UspA family protein
MKKNNFPQDWQLFLFAAIMFFLCLQGCSTSKQVTTDRTEEEIKVKANEEAETDTEAQTKTETKVTSKGKITEKFDTVIKVWPVVDGKKADIPVDVNVQGERTTEWEEYAEQKQEKNEQEKAKIVKKKQEAKKSDIRHKDKTVERTGLPWWGIVIIIMAIIAIVAGIVWKIRKRVL